MAERARFLTFRGDVAEGREQRYDQRAQGDGSDRLSGPKTSRAESLAAPQHSSCRSLRSASPYRAPTRHLNGFSQPSHHPAKIAAASAGATSWRMFIDKVRDLRLTFRGFRRGAQQAPCFTGANVVSRGGNLLVRRRRRTEAGAAIPPQLLAVASTSLVEVGLIGWQVRSVERHVLPQP